VDGASLFSGVGQGEKYLLQAPQVGVRKGMARSLTNLKRIARRIVSSFSSPILLFVSPIILWELCMMLWATPWRVSLSRASIRDANWS
jgi:hypothetical protein